MQNLLGEYIEILDACKQLSALVRLYLMPRRWREITGQHTLLCAYLNTPLHTATHTPLYTVPCTHHANIHTLSRKHPTNTHINHVVPPSLNIMTVVYFTHTYVDEHHKLNCLKCHELFSSSLQKL